MHKNLQSIIKNILNDIRVDLTDEFDQNFERQAFFSEAWQRRKSPTRQGGHILVDTGQLRRAIHSRITDNTITFYSDLPYAAIHNEGGEIIVTAKMKRFFWHKYYETTGAFTRKKSGHTRKKNSSPTGGGREGAPEAEFWKFMALKKAGTTIRIPRRQFLGTAPEVEQAVRNIIEENITDYIEQAIDFEIKNP